jgi:hypothetical protein
MNIYIVVEPNGKPSVVREDGKLLAFSNRKAAEHEARMLANYDSFKAAKRDGRVDVRRLVLDRAP